MRKVLIALSSDAENLSLVRIYCALIEMGVSVDVWRAGQNATATKVFWNRLDTSSVVWDDMNETDLSQYNLLVCGRTCYEAMPLSLVLSYQGIILADDTAMYDGKNVYGDIVCVNGQSNRQNISSNINPAIFYTGCLKADGSARIFSKEAYDGFFQQTYAKHVLYVESGHFPFGVEGRRALAEAFCNAVVHHRDTAFIVKPRYLRGEGSKGRHRNADHLYGYIESFFDGLLPVNLVLLNQSEDMGKLIAWADTVLYTYSSAHIEAVRAGKSYYHLSQIPSIETAEFRKNRMNLLEGFMDLAGCTIPYTQLTMALDAPHKASFMYSRLIDSNIEHSIESFASLVLCVLDKMDSREGVLPSIQTEGPLIEELIYHREYLRLQRIKGYFLYRSCLYENLFDDYTLCDKWFREQEDSVFEQIANDGAATEIERILDRLVMHTIQERNICDNLFDRAFVLRYYHETGRLDKRNALLGIIPKEDTAWLYYTAMRALEEKNNALALDCIRQYITLVEQRGFALTDAESNVQFSKAQKLFEALYAQQI